MTRSAGPARAGTGTRGIVGGRTLTGSAPVVVPPQRMPVGPARTLTELLDVFADAFSRRDADRMADCYAVPAVVLTGERTVIYRSRAEMVEGFAAALDHHGAAGLTTAAHTTISEAALSGGLREAVVRWDHTDRAGCTRYTDAYRYLLRHEDRHGLRIEVAAVVSGAATG